jgi:hypothetical protein
LPKTIFLNLQQYCKNNKFRIVQAGDKSFSMLETPKFTLDYLQIQGYNIIFSFIRSAYKGFDDDLRIHSDGIIMNKKTDLASVLYINEPDGVTPNGTALYSHHIHGQSFPIDATEEEFNRLLLEDSNNISLWKQNDYIASFPNRLLTYSANMFHSKVPKEITEGIRIVLVVFYSKNT